MIDCFVWLPVLHVYDYLYCITDCIEWSCVLYDCMYYMPIYMSVLYDCLYCMTACTLLMHVLYDSLYCMTAMYCTSASIVWLSVLYDFVCSVLVMKGRKSFFKLYNLRCFITVTSKCVWMPVLQYRAAALYTTLSTFNSIHYNKYS